MKNIASDAISSSDTVEKIANTSHMGRAGYLGMSPAFVTDIVRMESVKEMHRGDYEVVTISEHPEVDGHMCADFSSARGWNTILGGFFDILCLDYSWIQRDYFYTNYGGKRWFYDPSVPDNAGFVKRFFEWNGRVILLPLDERGDVWHEFCKYQHLNHFDYQLLQHEACPLVQATRKSEYTKQWAAVPSEFKCKTDRNQRRYLRASQTSNSNFDVRHYEKSGNSKEGDSSDRKDGQIDRLAANATHIAFLNPKGGIECLGKYVNHRKAEFLSMAYKYPNPTGISTIKSNSSSNLSGASTLALVQSGTQTSAQWVQCDQCGKWRTLPNHVNMESLPEHWYCAMNEWDDAHNSCLAEEVTQEGTEKEGATNELAVAVIESQESESLGTDIEEVEIEALTKGDLLASIPRNYPPAVIKAAPVRATAGRHSTPRAKRSRMGDSAHSRTSSEKKKPARDKREPVIPLVAVTMEQLPPSGELIVESWVQCDNIDCGKWHQVADEVLTAVKGKRVTCSLMALECTKISTKEEAEEEVKPKEEGDPLRSWTISTLDATLMQCKKCGTLSYKRDVLRGKDCDICAEL